MKRIAWISAALLVAAAPAALADGIKIAKKFPYASDSVATEAVRNECKLETNIPEFVADYAKGSTLVDEPGKDGRVFTAKITQVIAPGGGAWSGPKSVLVEGEVTDNGKVIGTVRARRNTSRGGYGTCGMLNFAAKASAKDIAEWLKAPSMDAHLGDAK